VNEGASEGHSGLGGEQRLDEDVGLLIAAPLRLEALLIRSAARNARVRRTGMGHERSFAAARKLSRQPSTAVLVMGFCAGLQESARPGDVIVADSLLCNEFDRTGYSRVVKPIACVGAAALAGALADGGLRVRRGTVLSIAGTKPARGAELAKYHEETGAIAVDMESAWLAFGLREWPLAAVRVVVDTPVRQLRRPLATVSGGIRAAAVLRRVASAVDELVRESDVDTVFGIDS
jgi:4-hydroxy-3-methylbut-2-en-1-yl diphosphate reductase